MRGLIIAIALAALVGASAGCSSKVPGASCRSHADCGSGMCQLDGAAMTGVCVTCDNACAGSDICIIGACKPPFGSVTLLEPAAQSSVSAKLPVSVEIAPTPESPAEAPAVLTLIARHQSGAEEQFELMRTERYRYTGSFTLAHQDEYTLIVRAPDLALESSPVPVTVANCPEQPCAAGEECLHAACVPIIASMALVPFPSDTVGRQPNITVQLVRTEGTLRPPPTTLAVQISDGATELATVALECDAATLACTGRPAAPITAPADVPTKWTLTLGAQDGGAQTVIETPIKLDVTGPALTVKVQAIARPTGQNGQSFVAPNFGEDYVRRDETMTVELVSDEPLKSVRLSLSEPFPGTRTCGNLYLSGQTSCVASGTLASCTKGRVNLADCGFLQNVFQSQLTVDASASDLYANNSRSSVPATISYTRFKWTLPTDRLTAPMAIGRKGKLYFTTAGETNQLDVSGNLVRIPHVGTTYSNLIATESENQIIAVGHNAGAEVLVDLLRFGETQPKTALCPAIAGAAGSPSAGLLYAATESYVAGAVPLFDATKGSRLALFRAPLNTASGSCEVGVIDGMTLRDGSSVSFRGNNLYLIDGDGRLHEYAPDTSAIGWLERKSWSLENRPFSDVFLTEGGAALVGTYVASAGSFGGFFSILPGESTPRGFTLPAGTLSLAVAKHSVLVAGLDSSVVLEEGSTLDNHRSVSLATTAEGGSVEHPLRARPVIGATGRIYTRTQDSWLMAISADETTPKVEWSRPLTIALDSLSRAGHLALDCKRTEDPASASFGLSVAARSGVNPGVVYAEVPGGIAAFIGDDRGPKCCGWPRDRHDPQNTANVDTSVGCPQ